MKSKPNLFLELLKSLGVKPQQPASRTALAEFEKAAKLKLPKDARELYSISDGVVLKKNALQILSLAESLTWVKAFRELEMPACFGYFPCADDYESNPFCICCKKPIKGMIVRVRHDDAADLVFRALDSCIEWLATLESDHDWFSLDKPGDLAGPTRTKMDLNAATELQDRAGSLTDAEQTDAERFALTLLSEAAIDGIIDRLESNDTYVREAAEMILNKMDNPHARDALKDYRDKLREFADRCAQILAESGIKAEYDERVGKGWPLLWVEKGAKRNAMSHFFLYDHRNENSFSHDLIKWVANALKPK